MTRLEKLQDQAREKLDRLKEIRDLDAEAYTDEIREERKQLRADLERLEQDIKDAKEDLAMEKRWDEPDSDPLFFQMGDEVTREKEKQKKESRGGDSKEFADGAVTQDKHEYKSFGEQLMDVYTVANQDTNADARMKANKRLEEVRAATGLAESVPSDGGFLVQTDFVDTLIRRTHDAGMLVGKCSDMPISNPSNGVKIPRIDETSRADGSRWGGIRAYWEGEADEMTSSKPKFGLNELKLKKLTGLCYATDEMLQDSAALGAYISMGFEEEFGFKFDDAIYRGTGAGQPLGLLNAGCLVSVSKESGQAADTIVAQNIMKMYARMDPRSLPRAVWYINQNCWPQIFQLHLEVGTGGVPMYIEPGKLPDAPNGALLGKPIQPIEQCATLGDKGDIMFADLSRYLWAKKNGMQADTSIHVRFVYNETAFRFIVRCDGQPMFASALTPFKGSDTISPFVTLNART